MTRSFVVLIAALSVATASIGAHHRMTDYREDTTQTIAGTLVELLIRNPHSFLNLDVADGHGSTARWTIEWVAALQLQREGITPDTLKVGDHLVVTGYPWQDPKEHRLRLRTLDRPTDGWKWTGGFR